jgi:hypothetical protein
MAAQSDADLSTLDWILAILCSGIGCIVAIVYLIQGKPKATKMLIISIVMIVVWNVIGYGAQMMMPKQ